MTESEWLTFTDLWPMLELLEARASDRKLRLFAVACCRRVCHLMTDPRQCAVVAAAEQVAEGQISEGEFEAVLQSIVGSRESGRHPDRWNEQSDYITAGVLHLERARAAGFVADFAARGLACGLGAEGSPNWRAALKNEEAMQCHLLRDLFGSPFRPFEFDPHWLSGAGGVAVERARKIYCEGIPKSLSGLADLLEQTGCHDRVVIEHCRAAGPHARGCWVLDALLGHESAVRTGLITEADWRACSDPEPMLRFLYERGGVRKWRLFAIACCRRVSHLMADERSRQAIEVAARYSDAGATEEEMEMARSAADGAVDVARRAEYTAEADSNFTTTPAYAVACCRLYAASAARSAVCRDPRMTDAELGTFESDHWQSSSSWAAGAVRQSVLANFGSEPGDPRWEEANHAAESAETAELYVQCQLLWDIFGDNLGPPGEEGGWFPFGLPEGVTTSQAERWCLLPTQRSAVLRPEWVTWNNGAVRRIAEGIYADSAFYGLPILADALLDAGCDDEELLTHCRSAGPHVRGCWVIDLILRKLGDNSR